MKRLKEKIVNYINPETLVFLKHSSNYITADFISKALAFFSIPVYIRLMSVEEYGMLSVFLSLISVFTIILGLNFNGAVARYYYEEDKKMPVFIGNNLAFLFLFNILIIILFYFWRIPIASFFKVEAGLFFWAVIVSSLHVPLNIALGLFQARKESRRYSLIVLAKNIPILLLSILWIYLLSKNRYYGQIYSYLLVLAILSTYIAYRLLKIARMTIDLDSIKYALRFGLPLLPHALSGFLLTFFDRLIINQLTDPVNTGLYSFAYNIGMIMNVIVLALNRSWVPIFYDYLKEDSYQKINKLASNYSRYIFAAAALLILYSPEIVKIIGKGDYQLVGDLIPIVITGYLFVFLYTIYANYSFYLKKTGLISVMTMVAGLINVVLNYVFIPEYGYKIAAYTTLVSYSLLFVFHYLNVKFLIKVEKTIKVSRLMSYAYLIPIALLLFYLFTGYQLQLLWAILIKSIIVLLIGYFTFNLKRTRG